MSRTAQQRIHHQGGPAAVDQKTGHTEPPQNRPLLGLERLGAERLGLRSPRLTLHDWNPMASTGSTSKASPTRWLARPSPWAQLSRALPAAPEPVGYELVDLG
jgi:hypothetical protein